MLRSIRPSLVCRSLILVALILASDRIRDQAAASDYTVTLRLDEETAERESLHYGDKDFGQWCYTLRHELKPEVRIEGLKALGAFGVNGYAEEATAAICELMRGYNVRVSHSDDDKIVSAGFEAIKKIGRESVPGLKTALKSDKLNIRRFAAKAILELDDEERNAAASAVISALADTDWYVIAPCLDILQDVKKIAEIRKAVKAEAKKIIPALIRVVKWNDNSNRYRKVQSIILIGMCGPDAKDAVPALLEAFNDRYSPSGQEAEIVYALGEIGPAAKAALPVLKSRYAEYLAEAEPPQKESKPGLFTLLKKPVIIESRATSMPVEILASSRTGASEGRPLPQTVKDAVKKIEGK